MSNLINTYPVFENSQVLTSSQLNQVVSYLDQQNRLTRTKLIGMGIVCGLELSYDDSGTNTQTTISKGTAITSEGFLIAIGECETSWYRPYKLPEGVQYNPFGDPEQDVTLYELLKERPEDDTDVVPLDDDPGFLDDKFVLLFLETFDNDLKSCLGNTCDESGIDRIFTIRKLLISKGDLDKVLDRSGNVGNLYPDKFDLPDIVMPRALFNPDDSHSQDYTAFSEHYAGTFIDSVYPALFGDDSTPGALSETYSVYELLLGTHYDFNNPFKTSAVVDLEELWTNFMEGTASPGPDYRGIQYFYDFLKDLILAYNEFRETAFDLMAQCCPNMSLFPKHVMLGRAVAPNETAEEAGTYRHGFTQPPIYNRQKYLMEKTISLHKRLVLMVETFNLGRINNPALEGEDVPPLHITPSDEKNTPLSERSIPYYYDSKEEVAVAGEDSLEQHWNFDITRKKQADITALRLSYENQVNDQTEIVNPIETPLYYDLDSYPFLRIEGHIGRDYKEVADSLKTMKSTFDLPFDLVALQLNPDAGLLEPDYSCGFEDVQEEYVVAKSVFCSFASNFKMLAEYISENSDKYFESEEERSAYLDRLRELLEVSIGLCESLPNCVDEFNFDEFRQGYKALLQLIIYFNLLDEDLLVDMDTSRAASLYDTFLQIYYAFERRSHYLQREAAVFSSFIQNHPGIAHQAGVYKGGTFILVYTDNETQSIIADFALPYLCCGTENCVPMCDEENPDFEFDVPPLARPDYAVTTLNTAVDIHVEMNDDDFLNSKLDIEIKEEETENGGELKLFTETGVIRYKPGEGFTGIDSFKYLLTNPETEARDTGLVTVLVKEQERQEPEPGCYSAAILRCWGIKPVQETLQNRDFDPSNMTETQMIDTLLQSLRGSGGFTKFEIESNVLESNQSRRKLIKCIDESQPVDDMTREQLGNWIRQYQIENCGVIIEDNTNDPRIEITHNDVTMDELNTVLNNRDVEVSTGANREDLDNLLINTTHGMRLNRDEVSLFTKDRIMRMLKNREIQFSSSSPKAELINKLFE